MKKITILVILVVLLVVFNIFLLGIRVGLKMSRSNPSISSASIELLSNCTLDRADGEVTLTCRNDEN